MFGYVVVNKEELKIKDFSIYRSFYCGLCQRLKKTYGRTAQVALNYDLSFLSILLSGLYEPDTAKYWYRCGFHPVHKHQVYDNPYIRYAADMTIVLTYLKCVDNWEDEHSHTSHMYQKMLKHRFNSVKERYPEKVKRIEEALAESSELEKTNCNDLDQLSACSGKFMAEILTYKEDEWSQDLRVMGDYLGRFIYLLDAYDDIEEDEKKHCFNPLLKEKNKENFNDWIKNILEIEIAHSSDAFEHLPILEYQDILRNIIYSGIWTKYVMIRKKRTGEEHE